MTGRFAIYTAPGAGSADPAAALLRERAEQWLGRSIAGHPVTPGVPAGWTREAVDAITVSARRYGFHATLKAPFHLTEGRTPEELDAALAQFAAGRERVLVHRLRVARLGGFFALIPGVGAMEEAGVGEEVEEATAVAAELYALADAVVTGFDGFRAPPTEAELARRDPASLTPRQRELLEAWGYPYVLDEFRFHLTVTDRIPPEQQPAVESALNGWFAASLGATVPVDALALFAEAEPGAPFTLRSVHPLHSGVPTRAAGESTHSEGAR
jgi:2'-5' RNA ligase